MNEEQERRAEGIRRMLEDIARETRLTAPFTGIEELDPRVMQAMAEVPRDAFVPAELRHRAWDNGPLPIGKGQTISQPFIVALMTHLLEPEPRDRMLEVGTGSGYQGAVLSRLVDRVYSVERVPELTAEAIRIYQELGYDNIETRVGNGFAGWEEHAPYDGIVVTAAASHVPPALVEQLAPGAHLVIPVGPPYGRQELLQITRDQEGQVDTRDILPVAFVPMIDED
ncbi:MAG: protein-L-isoaspartate(D-aspartate) O-methyltransferase [Gammaproteobacteria bacterium]|nr:MAG: protein-L-isoaspartate(D-aspartate) O-methyltransferase [Gammaproteobacteria bacterium]